MMGEACARHKWARARCARFGDVKKKPGKKMPGHEGPAQLPIADDRLSPSRGEQRRLVTNFYAATDAA